MASEAVAPLGQVRIAPRAPSVAPGERGARWSRRRRRRHELVTPWPAPQPPWRRLTKRLIDVIGASVALIAFSPVLAALAIMIRVSSPGRAIFAHERVGRRGRRFQCYKLRTMCAEAEMLLDADEPLRRAHRANDYKLPSDVDPRVTPLGRFLRASSLDEIPQFWNVLRGDMALVGPRPVVEEELAHYGGARAALLAARPGITGAWAVRGRSRIGYPERAAIELSYVQSWTISGDLSILLRTIRVVLQRRGAH